LQYKSKFLVAIQGFCETGLEDLVNDFIPIFATTMGLCVKRAVQPITLLASAFFEAKSEFGPKLYFCEVRSNQTHSFPSPLLSSNLYTLHLHSSSSTELRLHTDRFSSPLWKARAVFTQVAASSFIFVPKQLFTNFNFVDLHFQSAPLVRLTFLQCLDILVAPARAMVWILYLLSFEDSNLPTNLSAWSQATATTITTIATTANSPNRSNYLLVTSTPQFPLQFLHLRYMVSSLTTALQS
jgi:hypothetical protein